MDLSFKDFCLVMRSIPNEVHLVKFKGYQSSDECLLSLTKGQSISNYIISSLNPLMINGKATSESQESWFYGNPNNNIKILKSKIKSEDHDVLLKRDIGTSYKVVSIFHLNHSTSNNNYELLSEEIVDSNKKRIKINVKIPGVRANLDGEYLLIRPSKVEKKYKLDDVKIVIKSSDIFSNFPEQIISTIKYEVKIESSFKDVENKLIMTKDCEIEGYNLSTDRFQNLHLLNIRKSLFIKLIPCLDGSWCGFEKNGSEWIKISVICNSF